jgi:hypothetical protein
VGGERWREAETLSVREGEAETIGLSRERERYRRERIRWLPLLVCERAGFDRARRVGCRETRSIWATSEIRCRSMRELGVDLGADRWAGLLVSRDSERERGVGVGKGVGFPVGGGGHGGEGEIWEMEKILKMERNGDTPRFDCFFLLKNKEKKMTRGKKTEEGRIHCACVEALL